jgi:hypothetical protein
MALSIIGMADFEPRGVQRFFSDFALALMRRNGCQMNELTEANAR